jgi:ribonuclease HI
MPGSNPKKHKHVQTGLFDSDTASFTQGEARDRAVMYCDGACSGNPGKSGIGVVIYIPDSESQKVEGSDSYRISEYIGIATNNIAEYTAFVRGLEKVRALGVKKISVFMDSELLVRQMTGVYKVKNKNLIPLFNSARELLKGFDSYTITHVRRELNGEADKLAREAVKKHS